MDACCTILSIFLHVCKLYEKNTEERICVEGGICKLVFPCGCLASSVGPTNKIPGKASQKEAVRLIKLVLEVI